MTVGSRLPGKSRLRAVYVRKCSVVLGSAVGKCSVVFVGVRECSGRFGRVRSAVGQCSVVFVRIRVDSVVFLGYFGQVWWLPQVKLG